MRSNGRWSLLQVTRLQVTRHSGFEAIELSCRYQKEEPS
jgi:hypothetical protein